MHGSADPDPHLNVIDPQLCLIQIRNPDIFSALSNTLLFRWPQVLSVGTCTHLNSERMDPYQQRNKPTALEKNHTGTRSRGVPYVKENIQTNKKEV